MDGGHSLRCDPHRELAGIDLDDAFGRMMAKVTPATLAADQEGSSSPQIRS
jgi:hypothetical protein